MEMDLGYMTNGPLPKGKTIIHLSYQVVKEKITWQRKNNGK
jgi:hypothetical protein